jgi:hypothetical protein
VSEYNGCTPAYAGKEVNEVKNLISDGMSKADVDYLKKKNILNASSHDLLASGLAIFAGVFGKWQAGELLMWQQGNQGIDVLEAYWGE